MVASVNDPDQTARPHAERGEWVLETDQADWKPRDSSGEVVYRDQLWLMGGWFDSYSAPPRDVWRSSDGRKWHKVTDEAPWTFSDLPMTTVFSERMWLMGGWRNGRLEGHGATSEVWSSQDGADWKLETSSAGWSPRLAAGIASHNGRMWIAGGTENYYFGDASSLKNDVWSTSDGATWQLETDSAPWSARAYHQLVSHDGKLWVIGGGNYVPEYHATNDVWCSSDGRHWQQVTANAPWEPRLWFSAVSWKGHLWVIGGWSNHPSVNRNDVWFSKDGLTWKQLESSNRWKERHEHSVWVHGDRLFLGAGHAQPLSNEVWSLQLPDSWNE
ncbi:MAG: galactose oxidase [Planctomycetaceae bacterium]|nr:galactose oxidase [Planctomycetaceae bacterium]